MKTEKITVNRSADRPEGVEIEIVQPQSPLQERVLCFLLNSALRQASQEKRIPYELPDQFLVEHRGQGTFLVMGHSGEEGPYYKMPRPLAIVGIRSAGSRLELVHAQLPPDLGQRPRPGQPPEVPHVPQPPQPAEAKDTKDANPAKASKPAAKDKDQDQDKAKDKPEPDETKS